ncbi:unnamed protein product [Spirodela intermedia]|uniref:Uncharacterized protein n=2 Tax=Spirodela intermedia TaxID=51605 RepID=A0A7I8JPD5_SPIIN|nr:unnamed protein product [Spirodela intermedia]CAA6671635.1 unnamed protein product [Spirodela intermedia]CAA7408738.1 unnamed protein product [Spirodela intermedia]
MEGSLVVMSTTTDPGERPPRTPSS